MPIMSLIECIRELPLRGPRGNVIAVCHEREENPAEIARNEFNLGDSEIALLGELEGRCLGIAPPQAFELKQVMKNIPLIRRQP